VAAVMAVAAVRFAAAQADSVPVVLAVRFAAAQADSLPAVPVVRFVAARADSLPAVPVAQFSADPAELLSVGLLLSAPILTPATASKIARSASAVRDCP